MIQVKNILKFALQVLAKNLRHCHGNVECDCIRVAIHVENDTAYRNIVQGADTIIRVYTYNNPFSSRFNLKIKKHEVDKKLTTQGGTQFSMR